MKKNLIPLFVTSLLSLTSLSSFGQAEIQIIHNAADPTADTVDVYVDGALTLNDFAFRTASPFVTLPSNTLLNVGIAGRNSTSVNDTMKNFQVTLMTGQRYVAIANGVLSPANFSTNPDGRSTAFTLFIRDNIQDTASTATVVDFITMHGASDAPTVDVIARNVGTLTNDAAYGDFDIYHTVLPANYILDVTPNAGSPIVASFRADLSSLGGASAVVFASGFLDSTANQNGAAFGLFAALANGTVVKFPSVSTARLQVIHNAADPAADTVDVYLNGSLLLNDFAFRTASSYIDAPAGVTLNIGIAGGNSSSVNDTLVNIPVVLANGETYVAIANGVLTPGSFAVNPDGRNTGFQLLIAQSTRESGHASDSTDFIVLHGATDAITVDVLARTIATLVDNASYSDITPYISVPAANYIMDITPAAGSPIVASFRADLSSLGGASAVVFASGFLDSTANQNGAAFELFAALANGTVVKFPSVSTARLQVIHNAADPAADTVDVYLNGSLLLNDFAFRTASSYIDAPAGVTLNIGIAGGNSSSVNDTLVNFQVVLANGGVYLAVANGVLTPGNFLANPDAASTAFTLFLQDQMRESGFNPSDVDIRIIHGVTDAPTVDVLTGATVLVDNATYSNITPYLSVPAAPYILDITPGNDNSNILASYAAPLASFGGQSAVVLASGFLDPISNQNGTPFGLIAVLADGTVILLGTVTGIDEISNAANFTLSPNPAIDFIKINPANGMINSTVQITNSIGQVVHSIEQMNAELIFPISDLPHGIYFVKVQNAYGKKVSKLVID